MRLQHAFEVLQRVRLAEVDADRHTLGAFAAQFDEVRGDILLKKGDKAGALREYLKAKGNTTAGVIDLDTLQLKIDDLHAQGITDPQPAAAAPAKP